MKIGITGSLSLLLTGLLIASLTGCSLPLKSKVPVDQVYRLSPEVKKAAAPVDANIYLPRVTINPALDNQKIVLATTDNRLDFIANSRWADNLSDYLQSVMIDGLSKSGAYQSVSNQILGRQNNYRLQLRVADFQAEFPASRKLAVSEQQLVTVVVVIEALLLKTDDQRLVGQQRYTVRKQGVDARTSQIVSAFEMALSEVLNQLVMDMRTRIQVVQLQN